MKRVNIHEAKTHLSKLLEELEDGGPFIIAKAGKPIAVVTHYDAPEPKKPQRIGFMKGKITLPADGDIKTPFKEYIEELFYGDPEKADEAFEKAQKQREQR